MKPLGTRVLCRPIVTDETCPGGRILLLEEQRARLTQEQAEVIAAGSLVTEARLTEGAWIIHRPLARHFFSDDPDRFFLLEDDIVAVIE